MDYLFYPLSVMEDYYKTCDELDKNRYPGYHMSLLEDAAETNTAAKRKDLLYAIEQFHGFYFSLYQEKDHISSLIRRTLADDDQKTAEANQGRLPELEEQMQMFRVNVVETIEEIYEQEKKRHEKIAAFLGN